MLEHNNLNGFFFFLSYAVVCTINFIVLTLNRDLAPTLRHTQHNLNPLAPTLRTICRITQLNFLKTKTRKITTVEAYILLLVRGVLIKCSPSTYRGEKKTKWAVNREEGSGWGTRLSTTTFSLDKTNRLILKGSNRMVY
jgi:hypothetical protein